MEPIERSVDELRGNRSSSTRQHKATRPASASGRRKTRREQARHSGNRPQPSMLESADEVEQEHIADVVVVDVAANDERELNRPLTQGRQPPQPRLEHLRVGDAAGPPSTRTACGASAGPKWISKQSPCSACSTSSGTPPPHLFYLQSAWLRYAEQSQTTVMALTHIRASRLSVRILNRRRQLSRPRNEGISDESAQAFGCLEQSPASWFAPSAVRRSRVQHHSAPTATALMVSPDRQRPVSARGKTATRTSKRGAARSGASSTNGARSKRAASSRKTAATRRGPSERDECFGVPAGYGVCGAHRPARARSES